MPSKPITIRLPLEVLDQYKKKAEKEGVALSKFLADSCISWIENEKHMDVQQEPEVSEVDDISKVSVDGKTVHLTDPYVYKPHTFLKD
tara:strand:+ start:153 stop:416 length:264 start_codon:yes stop_codon:yes gene_type:complete